MSRHISTAFVALAGLAMPLAPASVADGRFTASGEVHVLGRSADGRYTVSGETTVQPAAASADGRFVLKATKAPSVGCKPFPDPLFADGFES